MVIVNEANSLVFTLEQTFGYPCWLEIESWRTGVSCRFHVEESLGQAGEEMEPYFPLSSLHSERVAGSWLRDVPEDVLSLLVELEKLYYGLQFTALWFLSRSVFAIELFLDSPVLFLFMLDANRSGQISRERFFDLTSTRRTIILAEVGLPESRACLRVLKALPESEMIPEDIKVIRNFFRVQHWELGSRLNYIDLPLLKILANKPVLLGSRLMLSYSSEWNRAGFDELYDDILRLCNKLDRSDGPQRISDCKTLDSVRRLHDRLVTEHNKISFAGRQNIQFGPPPLPGNDDILPVADTRSLHDEGVLQRHCIASFQLAILSHEYYAYSVLSPERATLGIRIDSAGTPSISQLKLRSNRVPSNETRSVVDAWFNAEFAKLLAAKSVTNAEPCDVRQIGVG